ncbi:MAG: N-acetylneuraminate synthase family protein, partial [Planctomycetes bacterium]|nr:N-acetylneuraminate synthase family protein [Planctomycetota bacterium]
MPHAIFQDLVIFELANNHQGSLDHGLRIIEAVGIAAAKYRIRGSVKLQYRDLDSFIHPSVVGRKDVKHIPRFLSTRLTAEQFSRLVQGIRDAGLLPMCTPFDETSVDRCLDHGMEILKIASCSADDWP